MDKELKRIIASDFYRYFGAGGVEKKAMEIA